MLAIKLVVQSLFIRVRRNRVSMHPTQICEFPCIAESSNTQFLSNSAVARLPAQQPKTLNAYTARGRYGVLCIRCRFRFFVPVGHPATS